MSETNETTDPLTTALSQSIRLENKIQALRIREMKRKADRQEECNKRRQIQRERRQALVDSCQKRDDEYTDFVHHVEHNEAMQREQVRANQLERERLCAMEREKAKSLRTLDKKIKLAELAKDYELDSFCTTTQKQKRKHEEKMERSMLNHRERMILVDDKISRLKADYEYTVKYGVQLPDTFFG